MAVGRRQHGGHRVLLGRIDDRVCSHLLRQGLAEFVRLHGDDLPGPRGPRHTHGEKTDRAAPQDHDGRAHELGGPLPAEGSVHGVPEGVVDRRHLRRDPLVHLPGVTFRYHHVVGEASVEVDA